MEIQIPTRPYTPNDLDRAWKRWIQLESRRRTAYLVYYLDTISALEANIPPVLTSCEISDIPLPSPDTIWKAPTAEAWLLAVKKYRPMTLDEAMRRMFFLPTFGAFDTLHEKAKTAHYNLLNESDYGPFARVAMMITLLRGVMDIGEGKRERGDWRDLTDLWVSCTWLRPSKKIIGMDGKDLGDISKESLRERFVSALERVSGFRAELAPLPRIDIGSDDVANSHHAVATRMGFRFSLFVTFFVCLQQSLGLKYRLAPGCFYIHTRFSVQHLQSQHKHCQCIPPDSLT